MKAKGEPVPSGCEMGSCCKKSERNTEDVKSQFPAQLSTTTVVMKAHES
jgi:hypothetical protein